MAQSIQTLLEEIAKKLRKLECICANTASTGSAIVEDYQPLSCDGSPIGDPINVMATISVAKQDVNICNIDALVGTLYNVPGFASRANGDTLGTVADPAKLHSITIIIIGNSGTVEIAGDLGDNFGDVTVPIGFSTTFTATTTFGTGDLTFTCTGDATAVLSMMSSL